MPTYPLKYRHARRIGYVIINDVGDPPEKFDACMLKLKNDKLIKLLESGEWDIVPSIMTFSDMDGNVLSSDIVEFSMVRKR